MWLDKKSFPTAKFQKFNNLKASDKLLENSDNNSGPKIDLSDIPDVEMIRYDNEM